MDREPNPVKAKVLVVEDSPTQREHIAQVLTKRGYDVTAVSGGIEALKAIKADPPDVVVLDVMLDDLDGYSVCRWVRLSDRTHLTIVIMLTVRSLPRERVQGLNMGADDYLPKPFDDDELEARIFAALRTREAREGLRRRNVELESLLARTEQLAMTDPLTGLFNRRRFIDVFRREFATARRYNHPLSVAIIDLDLFKQVNDTGGHLAGDATLQKVAALLSTVIREVDACARWGGDEFAVLLPHTTRAAAATAMQRACKRLTESRVAWEGAAQQVTFSIGIASTEDPILLSVEELLEAADRALYEAKRTRDCIHVARDGLIVPS